MEYGLALGGGGTRGAAHVGVLKALWEEQLLPTAIAGTSAGSIAAGLYAAGMSLPDMCDSVNHLSRHGLSYLDLDCPGILKMIPQMVMHRNASLTGFIKGTKLLNYFCGLTGSCFLSDSNIKTVIPAVDLKSGNTVVFTNAKNPHPLDHVVWENRGKLCEILMASASVPTVFQPRDLFSYFLVDGGITNNLPTDLLTAAGESLVIAVDVGADYTALPHTSIFEIASHSLSIMERNLKDCTSQNEVLLLKPPLPETAGLLTFEYMSDCMEIGYTYTKQMAPQIRNTLALHQACNHL